MSVETTQATEPRNAPQWVPIGRAHIVDVNSFVFWVCAVAIVYGAVHLFHEVTSSFIIQAMPSIGWSALVQWSLYAGVFAWILFAHQLFVRRSAAVALGGFLWGASAAIYFAAHANNAFEDIAKHWFGADVDAAWVLAISAATNEESLKLLGVAALFLLPRARLRGGLDGLFYGAIVGLGFQVVEDFIYTTQQAGTFTEVFGFMITRGLASGLFAHATYTAITGYGLGYCISRRDRPWGARLGVGVGAFAAAWFLHVFWDSPVFTDAFGSGAGGTVLVILVKGLPIVALLLFALRQARDTERGQWNGFVDTYIDPAILPTDDVAALQSGKTRKAARRQAKHAGGRRAKKATELLQEAELRYVQAVYEEGATSDEAEQRAAQIAGLRDAVTASADTAASV